MTAAKIKKRKLAIYMPFSRANMSAVKLVFHP
eukprot:CAMPEP_0172803814 /NCGR_PEP_ID=MMETSP1075-20121228/4758_1 /TAXON_ID=2916 /ORGANISM="Ceratium fusus, Strain PA161109" /LENGTH=31 /DNA_ID= /DNA_START= /DNA_END= /DNA_ORIENTATION=